MLETVARFSAFPWPYWAQGLVLLPRQASVGIAPSRRACHPEGTTNRNVPNNDAARLPGRIGFSPVRHWREPLIPPSAIRGSRTHAGGRLLPCALPMHRAMPAAVLTASCRLREIPMLLIRTLKKMLPASARQTKERANEQDSDLEYSGEEERALLSSFETPQLRDAEEADSEEAAPCSARETAVPSQMPQLNSRQSAAPAADQALRRSNSDPMPRPYLRQSGAAAAGQALHQSKTV